MFMTIQSDHGVVEGERVCLFGSGGFRPSEEATELPKAFVVPDLSVDTDHRLVIQNAFEHATHEIMHDVMAYPIA